MNEIKNKLFEMMDKLNPDFSRPQKEGVDVKTLSPEDQNLFKSMFDVDEMRGASGPNYDGNYIRTKKFRFWDEPEGKQFQSEVERQIQEFNSKSIGHDMVLKGLQDWDTDDDRTWDASYSFTFILKQ